MIRFPETVQNEIDAIAKADKAAAELRKRLERDTQIETQAEKLHVLHGAKLKFQQELDAGETPPVVIQTMAEYLATNSPVLVDMIDGVMKEDGLLVVIGPAGAGKSSLVVQVAHSVLTGTPWLGQPVTQINGAVGLMSYDQSVSIPYNWMSKMGLPTDRVSGIDLNGKGNPLNVPVERAKIVNAWRQMKIEVVIIDSFSAAYSGDQNDAGLVMEWYRNVKKFALVEVGAKALIVLVHATEAAPNKARGSTVHQDVADSMLAVVRGKANERKVEMVKYRAGLGQTEMGPVILTAPDPVTHLVDLDIGAMALANMHIPAGAGGAAFTALPTPNSDPDTDSDSGIGDDL